MLQINCPWCGVRDETDFVFGGEAHVVRPANSETVSDAAWADYLFFNDNPRGLHYERWQHRHGCRQWFNAARDTVTHQIFSSYQLSDEQPVIKKAVA